MTIFKHYEMPLPDSLQKDLWDLRQLILRTPLGLNLFTEDLSNDQNNHVILAFNLSQLIGCVMIQKLPNKIFKIRQMAVDTAFQKKGIGNLLLKKAVDFCQKNQAESIVLHARKAVIWFYHKTGFQIKGVEFMEVGIPHIKMILV